MKAENFTNIKSNAKILEIQNKFKLYGKVLRRIFFSHSHLVRNFSFLRREGEKWDAREKLEKNEETIFKIFPSFLKCFFAHSPRLCCWIKFIYTIFLARKKKNLRDFHFPKQQLNSRAIATTTILVCGKSMGLVLEAVWEI